MPQSLGLCVLRPTEIARSVFCLGSDHTEPCLESRSALAGTPGCRQELSSAIELLCWAPTFLWGSQGIYGIHQSLPACSTQQSPFSQSWNVLSNPSVSPEQTPSPAPLCSLQPISLTVGQQQGSVPFHGLSSVLTAQK